MNEQAVLEYWTNVCANSVRKRHGHIAPVCHPASEALADFLNQKQLLSIVLKVQIMLPRTARSGHSVVLALNKYILDPTFGQFHEQVPDCPDYLVFEEQGMLDINRKYASGESDVIASVRVSDSKVSYFPANCPLKERLLAYLETA